MEKKELAQINEKIPELEQKIQNLNNEMNFVSDYETIHSIITKVNKFGDFMKNHVTTIEKENCLYLPYREKLTNHGYYSDVDYIETKNGKYYGMYITPCCHKDRNEIRDFIGKTNSGNPDPSVYGTREELENWKHFVFNNKLPLFLNIIHSIGQNNDSKECLPWLVNRKYTDDEINKMFGFTDDEIKLIDYTIKKYERNSIWFKRYMCGKESITDEDVMSDIERIRNEVENEHKTQSNVERR